MLEPFHEIDEEPALLSDARQWAEVFLRLNPSCGLPEDLMAAWFANAMMRGYDEAQLRGGGD